VWGGETKQRKKPAKKNAKKRGKKVGYERELEEKRKEMTQNPFWEAKLGYSRERYLKELKARNNTPKREGKYGAGYDSGVVCLAKPYWSKEELEPKEGGKELKKEEETAP